MLTLKNKSLRGRIRQVATYFVAFLSFQLLYTSCFADDSLFSMSEHFHNTLLKVLWGAGFLSLIAGWFMVAGSVFKCYNNHKSGGQQGGGLSWPVMLVAGSFFICWPIATEMIVGQITTGQKLSSLTLFKPTQTASGSDLQTYLGI